MNCWNLEILHPENGQVLEHGDLVIRIMLDDYQLPSQLHGSKICVALSWTHLNTLPNHADASSKALDRSQPVSPKKSDFAEQCFDEVPDFSFQAFGLSPGTQYTLRIALYGR